MVYQHTETEIKGAERNCQARADDTSVKYTEQQIEEHCKKIDNLYLDPSFYKKDELLYESVQIIRQQQEEISELSEIVRVFQET